MTTASPTSAQRRAAPGRPAGSRLFSSIREASLEHRLVLSLGFMSFIPILLIVWTMVYQVDLTVTLRLVIASVFFGYFFIARRMVKAMLAVTARATSIASGETNGLVETAEHNEIGELAKAFNRITQELELKIDELESSRQLVKKLLSRIGTAIISYEGIDNILSLIMENTAAALEASMGSLMLVDGEKQELFVKSAFSRAGEAPEPDRRFKVGDGIAGWVVKEGRAMRGKGQTVELGFSAAKAAEGEVLCVPLKLRERPMGVVLVFRPRGGAAFTEDDESLVASIGSQMAVAIENYRLNLDVERTYVETIMALALAVEAKDPYSAGHSKRVGFYAMKIGEAMQLDEETLRILNDAGVLHDIGKIGIKDEILLKVTQLTPDEMKIMEQHPLIGEAIVKPVRSLQRVVALVRHHHERYDGSGYPSHLKGDEIPFGARILSVADTYDAMITDRPYRKRLPLEEAKAELRKIAGSQLDPAVVDAFLKIVTDKEERLASAKAPAKPA